MKRLIIGLSAVAAAAAFIVLPADSQNKPKAPKTLRLYVIDCGTITMKDPASFGFTKEEIGEKQPFAVPCYLVVHPKGTLMWEAGVIPDSHIKGGPTTEGVSTVTRTLRSELAEVGYRPEDMTYVGFSHLHTDHTANANDFAGSTWLVHQKDRDAMFAPPPAAGRRGGGPMNPSFFDKLKDAKTKILPESDYDVFGDGTVVIQYAPGHTPGHQMLFVKLKEAGPILIAGDLYHLPQEITMHRFPSFEFDKDISAVSREKAESFLKKSGARLWIEHDLATFETLKKSPDYYE